MYVGIDIGATWTRIGIADSKGRILKKVKKRTPTTSNAEFLDNIVSTIKELLVDTDSTLESIGIGSIGPINMKKGIIVNPPNIPLRNIPIVDRLKKEFKVPVLLVNDCTAAVIGEKFFGVGASRELDNMVYVTLSSGIGGGAIVDGHVLFGKDGNAVEIGHMVVDFEGRLRCGCGGYGHWEAYTSGKNVSNFVEYLISKKYRDVRVLEAYIRNNVSITYEILFRHIDNSVVKQIILEDIGRINAIGFANINNMFDPEIIVVGGSIVLENPSEYIIKPIIDLMDTFTTNAPPEIIITPLGDDVVLFGSIALAMHKDIIPPNLK